MPDSTLSASRIEAQKLRLGFIGGGINSAVGRAHFCASHLDGKFELVAGCFSKHAEINRQSAECYGVSQANTYATVEQLIAGHGAQLDALVVLTPTSEHLQPLLSVLQAGIPVICEKAMVASLEEAQAVCAAEQQAGGFVAVTYNYTGYPCLRELRQIIDSGRLGKLLHFEADMPQEGYLREDASGRQMTPQAWRLHDGSIPTVYLDLGAHLHQIMHYLIRSEPQSVSAYHRSYGHFDGVIDYVNASVEYQGGVHGSYVFGKSMLGHRNGLHIRVYGDQASAEWLQSDPEILRVFHKNGQIEILDRGGDMSVASLDRYSRFKTGHPAGYIEGFSNLYADIHRCILDFRRTGTWQSEEVFGSSFSLHGLQFLQAMANSASQEIRLPVYPD